MTDDIFYHCKAIGKEFTRQEWFDYCSKHRNDNNVIVASYLGFDWNINDVCLNPNVPCQYKDTSGRYNYEIRTAQCPCGAWVAGVRYSIGDGGGSCGCWFVTDPADGYPTEKAAVNDKLNAVKKRLEYEDKNNTGVKKMLAAVNSDLERYNIHQLDLFGIY